ncbi:DUF1543 domain-containing protein [Flavobacterium sp. ZB4P13]|uniref:DUF1543 domain-containing protein n=1 Tax=Flavobacterium sp. ZB4P13 TaxID=3401728 RepID=UPI003AAA7EB6
MLGCTPEDRLTEQHDIFFEIGNSLKELTPHMNTFWLEAKGKIHIDMLNNQFKEHYSLKIIKSETPLKEDELHIGYLKLDKIAD